MEVITVGSIHHVQSEHSSTKSDCTIDGLLTFAPASETQFTSQNVSKDSHEDRFTLECEHQDGTETNLAIAQNVSKRESIARNSNSKIRPKSSSKLPQIIETCKKLQAHQNAVNMKHESEVVLNISPIEECCEQLNSGVSEVDASLPMSEPAINQSKPTTDDLFHNDFCLHKDNENDSSSNSINLSPPSNDSSILSSQFTSESASDLVLKKFLFLFRPSDHEVLFRHKGINMFRCNVCGGMYRQKFSLKRHFLRSHINLQYISEADISNCKITIPDGYVKLDSNAECGETSNGRKKFKSSNAIFLENNKTRVMPGLYICHICVGIKFDFEQELRDHYNRHSDAERKKFQCDKCGASFFKKQILSRHLASHGEKVAQKICRRCGSEFSTKDEYQKHLASHSSGRVCKYCSKILSTSANRKRHESLHLGLKPYRCTHCGMCFAQSMDLDRHLRKQHNDLCHFCDDCGKLFPSQASLNVHMLETHSGAIAKKAERSCSPEPAPKPNIAKPASVSAAVPVKLKICFVCKRHFSTFYAMMKHRSQAHPFHTKRRRNRKTMKQKMAAKQAAKELTQGIKIRSQYVKSAQHNNFSSAPVRRGRPRIERSVQFGKQNERSNRRLLSKRERELAEKEEMEFYCNLSENIAENLLHFVHGKASHLNLMECDSNNQWYPPCNFEERGRLPWSSYNFPNGYDVDHALNTRGQEVENKLPENLSSRDKCLFATGLNRVRNSPQAMKKVPIETPDSVAETVRFPLSGFHKQKIDIKERRKLIGRKVSVICVCKVCRETFESNEAFKEHCVNNHPNVACNSVEIESNTETPPVIPENLCRNEVRPEGVIFTCNVPPLHSDNSVLMCTQCESNFQTSSEFHSHLVTCGDLQSSPNHVWKSNVPKRIKGTMRKRMSLAKQDAIKAHHRDFKTPEKHSLSSKDRVSKSKEKISRSAERSQFYKSGRLQTTSFTVDMNYFKTKPVKPVTTVSKRGRKSYATLSYRYRNASMQSSSSLECSNCKEIFPSLSTMNLHLQIHCNRALSKRNEISFHATDFPQNKMANAFTVRNIATAGSTISNSKMSVPLDGKLNSAHTNSPQPFSSNPNALCVLSNASEKNLKETSNTFNTEKCMPVVNSKVSNLLETPIDLSKDCNDESFVSLDLLNKTKDCTVSNKSAVEVAMDAIKDYFSNPIENEHLSKLQMTVEKLAASNNVSSVLPKTPTHKKVGRPKKVKRLGPFSHRKNLPLATNGETASKSISKLDITAKRLEEINFISDLPSSSKTSNVKQIDASGNCNQNTIILNTPFDVNFVQPAIFTTDKTICKDLNPDSLTSKTSNKNITISTDKNFVPIIIFGDQNKPNKAFGVTDDNVNIDKLKKNVSENSSIDKYSLHGKTTNNNPEKIIHFDDPSIREKTTDLPGSSKSESPGKKSDKSRRSSGSQGRISPSLESIVNSIKQKLHSQEQETSPNDDVAISWLEDEKFEIPPSVQRLKFPVNSNSNSSLSLDSEHFLSVSDANASSSQVNSDSIDLQCNSKIDSVTNLTSTNSDLGGKQIISNLSQTVESTSLESSSFSSNLQENTESSKKSQDSSSMSVLTSKNSDIVPMPDNKSLETLFNEASEVENNSVIVSTIEKEQENPEISVSKVDKRRRKKAVNFSAGTKKPPGMQLDNQHQELRRRPGRPRKKALELNTKTAESGNNNINSPNTSINNKFESKFSDPEENDTLAQVETQTMMHDVEKREFIGDTRSSQEMDQTDSILPQCHQESTVMEPESDESQNRPCCTSTPDTANCQLESNSPLSKMSSLRAFRAKLKPTQASNSEAPSMPGCSLTTEFGKSLASRMKEKMRLSFENASVENLIRSDECNSMGVPDASPSDAHLHISDDDSEYIKAIKKELESSDPTKKHSCPFCMLEFAYLTNFRRHLDACRTREEKKVESIPNTSTTVVQHLPKKDEVEHSMLHLLRHQNRQTAMLQEAEKSTGSKVENKFRTYNCNVCHRIYFSLFKLLQHQVTHKLVSQDSSEQSALGTDVDDSKDLKEIGKYSDVNELVEGANNNSEICKDIIQNHDFKFMNEQESVQPGSSHNEVMSNQSTKQMVSHFDDDVQRESGMEIVNDPQNAISLTLDTVKNETENIQPDMQKNCDANEVTGHSDGNKVIKSSYAYDGIECSDTTEVTMTMDVSKVTKNSIAFEITKKSEVNGITKNCDAAKVSKNSGANGVALNGQEQPVKRKRGRPFGWRKYTNNVEGNKPTNALKRSFKKVGNAKAVLFGMKKKGEKFLRSPIKRGRRKLLFTRTKSKHAKLVTNKMKEVVCHKQTEFLGSECNPQKPIFSTEDREIKSENSDSFIFQDLPISNEELLKFPVQHSLTKGITIVNNLVSSNVSKHVFHTKGNRGKQNVLVGSTSSVNVPVVQSNKLNQVLKRPRGRPPLTLKSEEPIVVKTEGSIVENSGESIMMKPENSLKRRPGRPPKNLSPIPSTSRSKGFQPGTRSFRKMMTRYIPEDSSDSESDVQEKFNTVPKKKVIHFKNCPICKEKFPASLILYRHIQLVHSRRAEDTAIKTEASKISKVFPKHIPKSSFDDPSPAVTKTFKKFSPKSMAVDKYDGNAKVNKKANVLTKDVHSNTSSTRAFKKISPKLPAGNFHTNATKVYRKSNAKTVNHDNSDASSTKVFRKIVPKSLDIDNSVTDGTKVYKKSNAKSTDLDDSDASSTKVFRKVAPKSLFANSSDADGTKVNKKTNAKATDFADSDGSTKFCKKVVPKSLTVDNYDSNGAKICKKVKTTDLDDSNTGITKVSRGVVPKSLAVDNCDAAESRIFKKVSRKAVSASNSETGGGKVSKTLIPESVITTNTGANRTKLSKKSAKSITSDNSDADSSKTLKRGFRKSIVAYNSDTESFKDLKKGILKSISVDNSDADSDFSVKTDITQLKNFRVCPICKEKFTSNLLLCRHIQLVHSRRSTSTSSKSSESSSLNKEEVRPSSSPPMKVKNRFSLPTKMKSFPSSPTKNHLSLPMTVKNRLSLPTKVKKRLSLPTKMQNRSSSTKMKNRLSLPTTEMMDAASRSTLSRQCVKPLPPMKRKWAKKGQRQDQIKKTKVN